MNVELGQLADGSLVVASDADFPNNVRRIEYHRDQRLMMLIYDDPTHDGELMQHELPESTADIVEAAATVLIVSGRPEEALHAYDVPLIQIGPL